MKNPSKPLLLLIAVLMFAAIPALASTVTVDENGNGNIDGEALTSRIGVDPGPGGLSNVLIYSLPFAGVQGDVLLTDAECGGCFLDVVRFNGDGTLIFYSDNVDGFDDLADTLGPPSAFYLNLVSIPEGTVYVPEAYDPGASWAALEVTYQLLSDVEPIPEPGTLLLFGSGLVALGGAARRRFRC